ncbi:endonuclease/exonuclease/phosphatase family protein [Geodermatophilus sabuli]|uniref:Endonuclease/exonuclease/phosphatase family protein n=1 Tax=Geodermatophilus sabuli TaxID=1564158 RepID=A0A7K3VY56_9ACTN|nr:endonuclease/exonuclease/phosphatase family protein [Geodermatophilus sabuli]NEK57043.1 endonuclease/exonuclease/phosphatase family protein [Geodermatophilus sabuli]
MAGWLKAGWQEFLLTADCDVWLLTEVNETVELPGYDMHRGKARMAARRSWAAVFSRASLTALPDPHVASAAAVVDGITYCSSILPWRDSGGEPTWPGAEPKPNMHSGRAKYAVDMLLHELPRHDLVWGGDWNHAISGEERTGSKGGRAYVLAAVEELDLQVPTSELPHRLKGLLSIDHIAVPRHWSVGDAHRRDAQGLSDHDCYVVEVGVSTP